MPIEESYLRITNSKELSEFVETEEFTENMVYKIFKYLNTVKEVEDLNVAALFTKIDADWVNGIALNDSIVHTSRLLLSSAFSVMESVVGEELLPSFSSYKEILDFQRTIQHYRAYLTLPSITLFEDKYTDKAYAKFVESKEPMKIYIKVYLSIKSLKMKGSKK